MGLAPRGRLGTHHHTMSFGGKTPTPKPDMANVDESEVATNQQAIAIPVVCGTGKVALRWVSPALNQFTRPVPTGASKK